MEKTIIMLYHHYIIDPTLYNWEEKIIMSYIRSWQKKGTCFGSDHFFCTLLGCTPDKLQFILEFLILRQKIIVGITETGSRILSLGVADKHPFNHPDYFNTTNNTDIFNI